MKKILIFIAIVLVLSGIVGGYLYYLRLNTPPSPAIHAVPSTAAVIIELKKPQASWKKFFENTDFKNDLADIPFFNGLRQDIKFIDSLLAANADAEKIFTNQPLFISMHREGAGKQSFLYCIGLPGVNYGAAVDDFVKKIIGTKGTISERSFEDNRIVEVKAGDNAMYHYFEHNGILAISRSAALIEDAIRQLRLNKSVLDDPGFKKVNKVAGTKVDANIYIQYKLFSQVLTGWVKPESNENAERFGNLASWSEVDMNIRNNGLMLNGFTFTDDTSSNYLKLFLKQKPQENRFTAVLPANTASFIFFGVESLTGFFVDYKQQLEKRGKLQEYEEEVKTINKEYNLDIEVSLLSWIGNEFGLAITEPATTELTQNAYAIFSSNDTTKTKGLLDDLVMKLNKPAVAPRPPAPVSYNGFSIGYINLPKILPKIFGPDFEDMSFTYYSIIGNFVVFANDVNGMKTFINYYLSGKTLDKDVYYSSFAEGLSGASNIFIYTHLQKSVNIFEHYANEKAVEIIHSNLAFFSKFEASAIQLSSNKESFYNNIYLKYKGSAKQEKSNVWEGQLDTTFSSRPAIVVNSFSKENEIFVQDDANTVYLLNNLGRILWKKELPEKMMGDVYQVEAAPSVAGFLFNTRNFIYLLDHDGNDVKNFPISLDAAATCPIAVFDYDHTKDYRIIVGCKNNKVYNFKKDGSAVKGWQFEKSAGFIISPFQYVNVAGKDYLLATEDNGTVDILARTGSSKAAVKDKIAVSHNNRLCLVRGESAAKTQLLATDSTGKIISVGLDGKVAFQSVEPARSFTAEHFFAAGDINNDNITDLIFLDLNELTVYDGSKNTLLFSRKMEGDVKRPPMIFAMPDKSVKIGIVDDQAGELYLLNADGSNYKGFPMKGNTAFSISSNENNMPLILVAGGENSRILIYPIE